MTGGRWAVGRVWNAMTLNEVTHWIPNGNMKGVSCIAESQGHWVRSVCGWMGPARVVDGPRPKRVCGACQAALRVATAIGEMRANAHALAEERSDDSQQRVVGAGSQT